MASSSSLLSEEQFLCPICLEVFNRPVSTPCGHNFCMSCITAYWDNPTGCRCPVCKETFERRPDLKVNTFISELALQFKSLEATDTHVWTQHTQQAGGGGGGVVLCDICTDVQEEAVKSCLECLTSYCEVHLKPHHRAAGLKRHTLVDPVESLADRICEEHSRPLVLFCRKDEVLLCDICVSSRHLNHKVVPVQRAYVEEKVRLQNTEAKVQQMIQERQQKVQAVRESVKQSGIDTKDVLGHSCQDMTALVSEIQKSQAELVKVMEEKQEAAEEQADGFIGSVEQEVAELQTTTAKLQELRKINNQLGFLQSVSNAPLLPHTMDLSTVSFDRHVEVHHLRTCLNQHLSQMRTLLSKINTDIKLFSGRASVPSDAAVWYMQQHEVDVVLNPDTAHPLLIISPDRKQVRYGMGANFWGNQVLNPNMFTEHLAVLGQRGLSPGKSYFEVHVGEKTEWCLGVAAASVQRMGPLCRSPRTGLWAIWFLQDRFETFSSPNVPVHLGKLRRVGVFVDYDGGEISFCDVENAAVIYSFTECVFTDELYPYFNPCDNEYGANLEPMIIVPVSRTL